jgi:hypothetical protein
VKHPKNIHWDENATYQFKAAIGYIKNDSIKNAEKVKAAIIIAVRAIAEHPQKHPLDKYKFGNDGTYRAIELFHYRLVYRVLPTVIKVISLRHTSMEPKGY